MKPSKRAAGLESPIRDIVVLAKKVQAKGKKMYWFNIGDPNKFDFDTPDYLKERLAELLKSEKVGHYSSSEGDPEFLEAVAERENGKNGLGITKDDVLATNGISEGLLFLFGATVEQGDEVLIPGPAYPMYIQLVKFFGGKPVPYRMREEDGWEPDVDDLRSKVTGKAKMVCVINPNNPTGVNYDKKTLEDIGSIAGENNLVLVGDEIYDQLVFSEEEAHTGLATVSKDVPKIIMNGFSKAYLIPGWRMGYMYFDDPEGKLKPIKEAILNEARQRLSPVTPIMKACTAAFKGPQDHIKEFKKKLKERGKFAYKRLNEIERIETQKPEGAFYVFPKVDLGDDWKTDRDFVQDVVRETGLVLPHGSGFDPMYGKSHFRSVILPPVEMMDEAFGKLEDFLRKK
jgi:alanine-synthesizing transaminase